MNQKKRIQGVVVSNKGDKTITVKVETYVKHPIYKKRVKSSHKFRALYKTYDLPSSDPASYK